MKNLLFIFFTLIILLIVTSCNSQDHNITMRIENKSKVTYDSLRIYFYSTEDTIIKNFEPNDIVIRKINLKNFTDPCREELVTSLCAFKDDYYYFRENGLIGFPYSKLENEYNYFVYDDYVTTKEGHTPTFKRGKKKISEFLEIEKQ